MTTVAELRRLSHGHQTNGAMPRCWDPTKGSGTTEVTLSANLKRLCQSWLTMGPLPVDVGAEPVCVPSWNYLTGSWVQAPQTTTAFRLPPSAPAECWGPGFTFEVRRMRPLVESVKVLQLNPVAPPLPKHVSWPTAALVGVNAMHPLIKLQHFDGNGSLEIFLMKYQHTTAYLHQDDEDTFQHLCMSLEEVAAQVIWVVSPRATMADLVPLLQTRFGTQLQAERFKAELHARQRAPGSPFNHCTRTSVGW